MKRIAVPPTNRNDREGSREGTRSLSYMELRNGEGSTEAVERPQCRPRQAISEESRDLIFGKRRD